MGAGFVRVISGKTGTTAFTLRGASFGDGFGTTLASTGDVNDDGVPELAVEVLTSGLRIHSGAPLALSADQHLLSARTGGTLALSLDAGAARAGHLHLVLGSISGTSPGFTLQGVPVPLSVDAWLVLTATNAGSGPLHHTLGTLGPAGQGRAAIHRPPLPVELRGLRLDHAFVTADPRNAEPGMASNPVPWTIVP